MNEKGIYIGTIDFDNGALLESVNATPLNLKRRGKCDISIYPKEGPNIPHFHLQPLSGRDICIYIFYPRLFPHGKNDGTLNSREARELNMILDDNQTGLWKKIRDNWIKAFPGIRNQCSDIIQPNYDLLVEKKPDKSGSNLYKINYDRRKDVYTVDGEVFILSRLDGFSPASCDSKNQVIIIPGLFNEPIAKIDKVKVTEFIYVKTKTNECKEIWISKYNNESTDDTKLEKFLKMVELEKIDFTK